MHQFAASRSYEEHLDKATSKLMAYQQGEYVQIADHIRNIKNLRKVFGVWIISDEALMKRARNRDEEQGIFTKTEIEYKLEVRNKALGLRAL